MAISRRSPNRTFGFDNALQSIAPRAIKANRAPTSSDLAEIGQAWIDTVGNDVYFLTGSSNGSPVWVNSGGGSGTFNSLDVTTTATIGTGFTVTSGPIKHGSLGLGAVLSSATGVLSSTNGTDGQLLIGGTGIAPAWASLASGDGSVVITGGANTLDIRVSGATASTFPTDSGTAIPSLGATTIAGGTNINTAGAAATVTINVDNAPTFSGLVTCQAGITQTAGTTSITSDTNAINAIDLHANGGVNETIRLYADQGNTVDSVNILSDVGGITFQAVGLASNDAINLEADAGGVDIDAAMQINIASSQNAPDAIVINSSAGGIDITAAGAAGEDIDLNNTAGSVNITSGENVSDAIVLNASSGGIDITAAGAPGEDIDITNAAGSINITANEATIDALSIQSINGGLNIQATTQMDIAATTNLNLISGNALTLNSSASPINIGTNTAAQNINIGILGTRVITIGNNTSTTGVVLDAGTSGIALNASGLLSAEVVSATDATGPGATAAVTINANAGEASMAGFATAAAATLILTVTNSLATTGSSILVSAANEGTNDAKMTVTRVNRKAGKFTVTLTNNGTAALNGICSVTFWILEA